MKELGKYMFKLNDHSENKVLMRSITEIFYYKFWFVFKYRLGIGNDKMICVIELNTTTSHALSHLMFVEKGDKSNNFPEHFKMTPPPLWNDFDRVSRKWWLRTLPGVWDQFFLPKTFLLYIWAQKII